jgi:DNA-binding NarL/FixJ family response regulator
MEPGTEKLQSQQGPSRAIRVGLVEDDAILRKLLAELLLKSGEVELAGVWGSGEEALVEFKKHSPEVVLVDLGLPGISGEECLQAFSALSPGTALVVLSAHDDSQRVFASLRAGANGYLLKSAAPADLLSGIKAAVAGGTPLSPEVAALVIAAFRSQPAERSEPIPLPGLAPRERQILELLAKGQVPKEVASTLSISYETVRDYLKQIYKKLHVRSRTEAVLKYLGSGRESGN